MNFDFTGKVALITGGSAGIGAGIAELFSKCGANLVLTGRREEKLKDIQKKCSELSPSKSEPLIVVADISKDEDNKRTVDEAIKKFGRLDVLVNNAALFLTGGIEKISMETYDAMMKVNVRAVFDLTKLCIPHLEKTKGNIVNISGIGALRVMQNVIMTCVSKAAVDHFTRCTALELAGKGIRVNGVNPGLIKTGIFESHGMSPENIQKLFDNAKNTHALGRAGEVEEVASAVAFLASDNASFITGVSLPVDGGRHAMCPR